MMFVLVGLPAYLQRQLQSVLNAAARLVFRRYDHITDALAILHWLRISQRVDFNIAVMAFRVLHGLAPPYLDQLVRVADLPGRRTRSLRSSMSHQLDWTFLHTDWNPSAVGRFRSPHQLCGTLYHLRFSRHLRWLCFVNDWRRISEIIPWCPTLMTTSPWTSQ